MTDQVLTELEHLVLLSVVRLGERAYGVTIQEELASIAGRNTSRAAVYVALRRLEGKNLVSSALAEPTAERGGRAKRFYTARPLGLDALRQQQTTLLRMWDGIEEQLGS